MSAEFDNLFDWSSRIWSIGPTVSIPILAQARNRANVRRVRAAFEEASARYRSQVLVAFSEVEDNLSGLSYLAEQLAAQASQMSAQSAQISLCRVDSITIALIASSQVWAQSSMVRMCSGSE